MNIVSLRIKNFLSLTDVSITPGQITQIVGENGQGKTSILKALDFAVQGSSDPSLVKLGEDSAEVLVELSDKTTIRRRLNSEGRQSLDVSRDGMKPSSPQAFVGALFDQSSFNPLEMLDQKKRHDAIMKSIEIVLTPEKLAGMLGLEPASLPPLDYSQHGLKVLEQCHKYFFARRAEANRVVEEKKRRWETYRADMKPIDPPRHSREDVLKKKAEIQKRMTDINAEIMVHNEKVRKNAEIEEKVSRYKAALENIKKQAESLEEQARAARCRLVETQKFIDDAKFLLEEVDPKFTRLEEILDLKNQDSMLATDEKMILMYENSLSQAKMISDMEAEYRAEEKVAKRLDSCVQEISGPIKKKIMSEAEMPVKGLSYDDGQFTVEGVSIDNLSTSAAMRLAVSVARKLAKKAKVICVDGAEALDQNTWSEFASEIRDDGYTYFVTRVGEPMPAQGKVVTMRNGEAMQ